MKQAKLLLFFVVTSAMLLAGCSGPSTPDPTPTASEDVSESPEPTPTVTDDPTEEPAPEPDPSLAEPAVVTVDYATDESLAAYDSFEEFFEPEDEGFQRIVFTTNVGVKDFSFIEIGFNATDSDVTFFENGVLHTLAELTPIEPFVTTWLEQGTIPHRGISFIDETDTPRHFYLTMSGEDGSLHLVEFENDL